MGAIGVTGAIGVPGVIEAEQLHHQHNPDHWERCSAADPDAVPSDCRECSGL